MLLKICGLTTVEDAVHAARAGATVLGVIFAPKSPRCISVERAREIVDAVPGDVPVAGVFVDAALDAIEDAVARSGIRMVQLHGDEPESLAASLPWPVLRASGVDSVLDGGLDGGFDEAVSRGWPDATLLLDAVSGEQRGGTGVRVDWARAAAVARRRNVVLAGGLTPENVAAAIAAVRPFGVDVSSGVERAVGRKDHGKVALFLQHAREALLRIQQVSR